MTKSEMFRGESIGFSTNANKLLPRGLTDGRDEATVRESWAKILSGIAGAAAAIVIAS